MIPGPQGGSRGGALRLRPLLAVSAAGFLLVSAFAQDVSSPKDPSAAAISKSSALRCAGKVERLKAFAAKNPGRAQQTTRFTEDELNSYLAIDLSSRYHTSLRSLTVKFEEPLLRGTAIIDFDRLSLSSTKVLTKVLARLFSGMHTLTVRGELVAAEGKGNFRLDEARFDGTPLPNFLVEEIITTVGRKQTPPFDPMTPSELPYRIKRVLVRRGYIDVYQ